MMKPPLVGERLNLRDIRPAQRAFTPGGWPRTMVLDIYIFTHPYLGTNASFYVCPTDRGPLSSARAEVFGYKTNQLPTASSYTFNPGLGALVKNGRVTLRQRYVKEVTYPSRKSTMLCGAITSRKDIVGGFCFPTGHAPRIRIALNLLFADGHSDFVSVNERRMQFDPETDKAGLGWNWSSPNWQDVR
jgi:prepilin-type processing-associated H-X9-DG protein